MKRQSKLTRRWKCQQSCRFQQADALWTSFQEKIKKYVNQNGGTVLLANQTIQRPDSQQIKDGKKPLSSLSSDYND